MPRLLTALLLLTAAAPTFAEEQTIDGPIYYHPGRGLGPGYAGYKEFARDQFLFVRLVKSGQRSEEDGTPTRG